MCAIFSSPELSDAQVRDNASELKTAFEELCSTDPRFQDTIKSTTKTEAATADRILRYGSKVEEILETDLNILDRARTLRENAEG